MLDIARDPRWGRIIEGFGEDPILASRMAKAAVEAYQRGNLSNNFSILSTAKHYVAYGVVQAGRDYHTVDISNRTLWETYMPPFEAAVKADVASIMTAFTTVDGVPVAANTELLNKNLRDNWGYKGIVVSDYNAIHELIIHGVAKNASDAAK